MSNQLTVERLKELLNYEPDTGVFVWVKSKRKAGCIRHDGYVRIGIDMKAYLAHRLAWLYMTGQWPDELIDHINRVKNDNRFSNLRQASKAQNAQNTKLFSGSKSGFKGVRRYTYSGKWFACITANGTTHKLGSFDSAEEAAEAYRQAAQRLHSAYAGEMNA